LQAEPVAQAIAHGGLRRADRSRGTKKLCDELVKSDQGCKSRRTRRFGLRVRDVNAAAAAEFHPALALEPAIAGADRVLMNAETPRDFSRAGETIAGSEIAALNGKNDLCDELLAQAHFRAMSEP